MYKMYALKISSFIELKINLKRNITPSFDMI